MFRGNSGVFFWGGVCDALLFRRNIVEFSTRIAPDDGSGLEGTLLVWVLLDEASMASGDKEVILGIVHELDE
jgi:hypothetical protein